MAYSILIVDDSEIIRSMISRTITLTKLPVHTFREARNGVEALDILNSDWIDIVFTDLNMPVMNGLDLIINMRKAVDLEDVPVIVITTEGNIHRLDELKDAGARDCIRKPFTPEKIRDVITSVLGVWDAK
ncbi:MAG: response regulator [Fibrobacterota bacterium]|jgi:two-component system chemotaxis response regulator CheY